VKTRKNRIIAMILAIMIAFTLSLPAMAAEDDSEEPSRASDYISCVYAQVDRSGNSIDVFFDIVATGYMTNLGAMGIAIYNNHGNCVAYLTPSNTSGLMVQNRAIYSNTITWNGAVTGDRYYAIVAFKAENSNGSDFTSYTTSYTT
jgi:hypothetical protein